MNELYYFDCVHCGTRNVKRFDALTGPKIPQSATCNACGNKDPLPQWIYPTSQVNTPRGPSLRYVNRGLRLPRDENEHEDRPNVIFQDNPEIERLTQKIKSMENRHNQEIESLREEYEERIQSNEERLTQYQKLLDLIGKRDEARAKGEKVKSVRQKREIDERLAQMEIDIAELKDIMGFKVDNR